MLNVVTNEGRRQGHRSIVTDHGRSEHNGVDCPLHPSFDGDRNVARGGTSETKRKLTPRGAVWSGLLVTPVLVVGLVMLIGVTAGSAGPAKVNAPAAPSLANQAVSGPVKSPQHSARAHRRFAQLKAYWTPERMANAQPFPMPTSGFIRPPRPTDRSRVSRRPRETCAMHYSGKTEASRPAAIPRRVPRTR